MDNAREKEIRSLHRRLATLLASDDVEGFEALLALEGRPDLLEELRVRRIILTSPFENHAVVRDALAEASRTVLSSDDSGAFVRQLDLMLLLESRMEAVRRVLDDMIARLPAMATKDLIATAQKAFEDIARRQIHTPDAWGDPDRTVAMAERDWQDHNGMLSDLTFAVCRAVNEIARRVAPARRMRPERRAGAAKMIAAITSVSSQLNSLEWVRDSVAFGDMDVAEIREGSEPMVRLEFRDPRRSLLRTLAVRRSLVMEGFGRRPMRFVRDWLAANLEPCLQNAIIAYEEVARPAVTDHDIMAKATRRADVYLAAIDFEDDMLVMAARGDPQVVGRYMLGAMLHWHVIAAELVGDQLAPSRRREFLPARIELERLIGQLSEQADAGVLRKAWDEQTVSLPAASHWDLVRRPFVASGDGSARPLLHGASGKWNAQVREGLVQGGRLAKDLGGVWEDRFADRFSETGWTVLGRGIRLKDGGRLLTDMDLLVVRGDLLLIAQVKALAGEPYSAYDHWRHGRIIEKGCHQAAIALERLRADATIIQGMAGRRVADRIAHVDAIVLTNSPLHEGWEHLGVPVLGETMLKAITVGSKVEYVDSRDQRIVSTTHFIRPEDLDTPTILAAIRTSVELRIAPESGRVEHVPGRVADITFLRPEFVADRLPAGPLASGAA